MFIYNYWVRMHGYLPQLATPQTIHMHIFSVVFQIEHTGLLTGFLQNLHT